MFKYKFLNILDSLSYSEFKTFSKFINSPFFNESKRMIEFYEFVKKFYHNHTFNILTPELISEGIFKTENYDSVKTRKLISDFNKLVENFLVHYSIDKDLIGKKTYLSNQFRKKELGKYYDNEIDDIKKQINNSSREGKSHYYFQLKLADEELFMKKYDIDNEKKIKKIKYFTDSVEQLHIFLKLYIYHILVQNNLAGESTINKYGFENLDKQIKDIEKNIVLFETGEPRIYLYYLTLKLITLKNPDKIYPEIENYIEKNRELLNTEDIEFSIYTIISYLENEISSERYEKIDVAVRVLKRIDEKGFLNKINEINHFTFIQIINFALYLKDIEYAEVFLWRYFPKLKKYKEDSMNLAIASLRFAQGRYSEAKDHIKKIDNKTYEFYLLTNTLLLKIFYEESSLKFIHPLVDSFKHFLKRNKHVPGYFMESFSLFLSFLTKLTSLKEKKHKDVFKFEYELSHEKKFIEKKWIEEKVSELIMIND
jgi:hypothetical protein